MSTPIELEKMRNTIVGERMEYERKLVDKDEQIARLERELRAAHQKLKVAQIRAMQRRGS